MKKDDDRHCSECKHYEICTNFYMYCKVLKRRITARKKPCKHYESFIRKQKMYLQPIITQYFIDNKSEIWLLFLIAHSKR